MTRTQAAVLPRSHLARSRDPADRRLSDLVLDVAWMDAVAFWYDGWWHECTARPLLKLPLSAQDQWLLWDLWYEL